MADFQFFGHQNGGNGVDGPGTSTSFTGPINQGLFFKVTADGLYVKGYGVWRADSSQAASGSCGVWQATGAGTGTFVSGTLVSISGMATGQWNYVTLATPVALVNGTSYKLAFFTSNNFSYDGSGQFAAGGSFANGITNGPLLAFSDGGLGSSNTAPFGDPQETFTASGSDASSAYPATASSSQGNGFFDIIAGTLGGPAAIQPSYAPGWHPGRGLPGMPGGTPFYEPPSATPAPAAQVAAPITAVQRPQIISRPRLRARIGARGFCAAGLAVAATITVAPEQRPPQPPRPAPARAHTGPQGRIGAGIASQVTTTVARPRPLVFRSAPPSRTRWHGNAGPQPAVSVVITVYQRPPPQPRRPAPRRVLWHGNAGLVNAAPVVQAYQRPPPQPRSKPPARGVWRRNTGPVTTVTTVTVVPRPRSKPPRRAVWHGNAGPQPVAGISAAPPRWRPLPARRKPARGLWRRIAGLASGQPVLQNATSSPVVTAGITSSQAVTGPVSAAAVTGPVPSATVTDPRDGTTQVSPAATSSPAVSDG